ncbi:MAG TPA: hypothetical protein VEO54_18445 [Thermoanaerobaculia bacterium]|nr:hypothetical protein [Thermoanaerobaculia bacterium]
MAGPRRALVGYRITDPLRSVMEVEGASQTLYRVAQLALREAVGAKELDVLLTGKEALARELRSFTRREETAAMRMQANTAKILESSPTLMKLKELEVLEKVAGKANLTVVLGQDGLADRVVKLL